MNLKSILIASLVLLISSTLLCLNVFIYRSLSAYYLYECGLCILLITTGVMIPFYKNSVRMTRASTAVILWGVYVGIHAMLFSSLDHPYYRYILSCCLFFISLSFLFSIVQPSFKLIYRCIVFIAIAESIYCLLQYFKLLGSLNPYFPVTGTWENPNVTAMFIAMASPAICSFFMGPKGHLVIGCSSISIFLFVLYILQCRTAFIGGLTGSLILFNYRYDVKNKLLSKKNRAASIILLSLLFAITVPLMNYVYQAKKLSADGRKLIWKISASMFFDKPVFGFGYGSFEKNYNLAQARYFEVGDSTDDEKKNAGFVKMGYNEFIQNTVEGGLAGLAFFSFFFYSLLIPYRAATIDKESPDESSKEHIIAYSGVVIFLVMSLLNFSLQAIPVMCLFLVYGAILSHFQMTKQFRFFSINIRKKPRRYNFNKNWLLAPVLLLIGAYGILNLFREAKDNCENKYAKVLIRQDRIDQAIMKLSQLNCELRFYESYWVNYANALLDKHDYANAIEKFNLAKTVTSNPNVYESAAICYEQTGDLKNAENDLKVAQNIEPGRMTPRFELLKLYQRMNNKQLVIAKATELKNFSPKIPSLKTQFYKEFANRILISYGQTKSDSKGITSLIVMPKKVSQIGL